MVEYTLNIKIATNWVGYFNDNKWQFCFARNSQSIGSQTTFNVIAVADEVANNLNVTWVDKYAMAGAKTGYSAGAQITISTNKVDIDFAEAFTLKSWADYAVARSKDAPIHGFVFDTTPSAAAVLYQTVNGELVPVYITPEAVLPPSTTETLVPQIEVAVWFQREAKSGYMIDSAMTKAFRIPMTTTTMTVEYNKDGQWIVSTGKVHYGLPDDEDPKK